MESLSPRQSNVLDFVRSFVAAHGYAPTLREIAAHLGISGTVAVVRHLDALEKKGWIRRQPGGFRSITLLADLPDKAALQPEPQAGILIPLVGTVRAGIPETPVEDVEDYISLDRRVAATGGSFFLRIKGDSMRDAGMIPGDLVLIRQQPVAENGDVVVALVDGEATVKRFFKENGRVRLQPENSSMEPIFISPGSCDITLIGKVVSLFRSTV